MTCIDPIDSTGKPMYLSSTWQGDIGRVLRVGLRIKPKYCMGRRTESQGKDPELLTQEDFDDS